MYTYHKHHNTLMLKQNNILKISKHLLTANLGKAQLQKNLFLALKATLNFKIKSHKKLLRFEQPHRA